MKEEIEAFVRNYVTSHKANGGSRSIWRQPLVAFADAHDPMFRQLKEIVDPNHLTPCDLLEDAKTVISYFVPFTKKTVQSNTGGKRASTLWAKSYIETNELIINLNVALSEKLEKNGYKAATTLPTHNFDEKKLVSLWSQKHVAYIAGLGKFGIHHMIITEKGCCGRLGSVITDARIKPTQRVKNELCLYKKDGACGVCVRKCALNALTFDGLNKRTCYYECLRNAETYHSLGLADVCGKCVTEIPCSFSIPRGISRVCSERP